jgi:hypothetical protein
VEGSTEGGRWEVHKAAINVAQLNATRRDSINARLHLIHERADAGLDERAGDEGVLGRLVGAGRLKVALVGAARASACTFESTKDEQLLLERLQGCALFAQQHDQGAQFNQRLRCGLERPFAPHG